MMVVFTCTHKYILTTNDLIPMCDTQCSYRWSQGLLFHQAMVDCARAAILIPLAHSLLYCVPVKKCSLVETAFLLLVTVSTINMLTIVLNDSPVFPEDDEEDGYQVNNRTSTTTHCTHDGHGHTVFVRTVCRGFVTIKSFLPGMRSTIRLSAKRSGFHNDYLHYSPLTHSSPIVDPRIPRGPRVDVRGSVVE